MHQIYYLIHVRQDRLQAARSISSSAQADKQTAEKDLSWLTVTSNVSVPETGEEGQVIKRYETLQDSQHGCRLGMQSKAFTVFLSPQYTLVRICKGLGLRILLQDFSRMRVLQPTSIAYLQSTFHEKLRHYGCISAFSNYSCKLNAQVKENDKTRENKINARDLSSVAWDRSFCFWNLQERVPYSVPPMCFYMLRF